MGIIRETCSFFRSIYEASKCLKPAERLEIYETVFDYMFYDAEVKAEAVKPTTYFALTSNKMAFDNAKKRYDTQIENGKLGAGYGKLGAEYGKLGGRGKRKTPQEPPETPRGGYTEPPKTPQEIEIDIEEEKEIHKEKDFCGNKAIEEDALPGIQQPILKSKKSNFTKPTLEEVRGYCSERNNSVSPEHFCDYYESNGWKVGKNSMKDWQAAVRTWERNNKETGGKSSTLKELEPGVFKL